MAGERLLRCFAQEVLRHPGWEGAKAPRDPRRPFDWIVTSSDGYRYFIVSDMEIQSRTPRQLNELAARKVQAAVPIAHQWSTRR